MPKSHPVYTGAKSNIRDRVLGEVEKNSYIAFPGKGGHSRLLPSKTMCPNLGEFGEGFYSNSSRVGLLTRLGCVQRLHSLRLVSGGLLIWWASLLPLILPQVVSWLFLPWLATVRICPLELREGHGGWSLAYKKRETKQASMPGNPTGPCSVSYITSQSNGVNILPVPVKCRNLTFPLHTYISFLGQL